MAKNDKLVQALCLPFCVHYKPGKNEELLCRGAEVVLRLMGSGRSVSLADGSFVGVAGETQDLVRERVCSSCPFREGDCDFAQDRRVRPCGGFVLLGALLEAGTITASDLFS